MNSDGEMQKSTAADLASEKFVSLTPMKSAKAATEFWASVGMPIRQSDERRLTGAPQSSVMESGVTILTGLKAAPPRTLHNAALARSSPMPQTVRAMLERREFGRCYDAVALDLDAIQDRLPGLACPEGDVPFLANDRSFDELNLSVDCLLQHRKDLIAPSIAPDGKRRHVLVLGAGPGGLMTAIQLSLRNHCVVVCEQREVYARNRYIGVYKEVTHLMAALGMPERMTYDFSQYRGKRGIMLADIQTFLHGVALKLGAIIYMGAVPRTLNVQALQSGEVELQRTPNASSASGVGQSSIGLLRWQFDTVSRVRSGVSIRFDTIVEATGGRAGLRELLVGPENIVSIKAVGRAAATHDPSLESFFADPEDHCAEYVESGYGCPPGLRESFANALLSGSDTEIPDEIPCFVSNIDASIFTRPMKQTAGSLGLASRIGDRNLTIPHDWVVLECRLADQSLSRYHVEGPLPQTFEFGGERLSTRGALDHINPVSLLFRILYAMGVPFDAVDRRRLIEFYATESSQTDTSDIVSTWVGRFRGLRLGGEKPIWCGRIPGSETVEYGIVGEALQNAWYRFGVGVDDTFAGAQRFTEWLGLDGQARLAYALRFERVMIARSVQVLYHLYSVARNTDQGVVGPVLTEYHMEEQHSTDVAEARLRDVCRQGLEIAAAESDVRAAITDPLLQSAFDYLRDSCCRRVLSLLESLAYPAEVLTPARESLRTGQSDWRSQAFAVIEGALSVEDRELVTPVFARPETAGHAEDDATRLSQERLAELAMGYYAWASPWLRACALRAINPSSPGAAAALTRAVADPNPVVAETAAATLALLKRSDGAKASPHYPTIEKVIALREVNLFHDIPHQVLARVALLLTERWADPGEQIIAKGELGDCLYIIESGRVKVYDDDRVLGHLAQHQSFGELSLLDAEPRSASVSAEERTHLFRLAQSDFAALMSERLDVMQGVNRVLCRMVRSANVGR
jgi:hypothetical protein